MCRDIVTTPSSAGQTGSLDPQNVDYEVLSGLKLEVLSHHRSMPRPKQLRMHGNTGKYGVEDSCEEFSIRIGKKIQVVRVGYDETLGGFTYISFAPESSSTIEFGQITPDTDLTTIFMPFHLVGF